MTGPSTWAQRAVSLEAGWRDAERLGIRPTGELIRLRDFGPLPFELYAAPSPFHGYGIFAGEEIPSGAEIFAEGPGEIVTALSVHDIAFNWGLARNVRDSDRGTVALNRGLAFDTPRANIRNVSIPRPDGARGNGIRCVAIRRIEPGEELLLTV